MKLTVYFKAAGNSTTENIYTIDNCPAEVVEEIKKSLKQEISEGQNIENVTMSIKNLAKFETGFMNALKKLIDRHSDKDDLVNVTLKVTAE